MPATTDANKWTSAGWRYRLIAAFAPNPTEHQMGAFVLAVLDKAWALPPPRYTGPCTIQADGMVTAPFIDRHGVIHTAFPLAHVTAIADGAKRLAEVVELDNDEATEWLEEVRKWIKLDMRTPGEHGRPLDR